ncbi:hypothetical protein WA158_003204 [Blastocystis sp. Blastoise]
MNATVGKGISLKDIVPILRNGDPEYDPEPVSIPHSFICHCSEFDLYPALVTSENDIISYKTYFDESMKVAKALYRLHIVNKSAVALSGFNCPSLFYCYQGCWLSDNVTVGIYSSNTTDLLLYILNDSHSNIFICDSLIQAERILSISNSLPFLKYIVIYGQQIQSILNNTNNSIILYNWNDFISLSIEVESQTILNIAESVNPGSCATLVYTSGTTGTPKGVLISHDACMYSSFMLQKVGDLNGNERLVSYLPLSHIAAQYIDIITPSTTRATLYFADSDCFKGTLINTIKRCHPTIFVGVPRVFEKMYEQMTIKLNSIHPIYRLLLSWVMTIGYKASEAKQWGKKDEFPWGFSLADSLVFQPIKKLIGLEDCRYVISSAGTLSPSVIQFFNSINLSIHDVYGQTESAGLISVNTPIGQCVKYGSVGQPLPSLSIYISTETNEILYKGRGSMMGYLNLPKETQEAFDNRGYIHTGDMGYLDDNHFLYITGRLKELIITAGGENIPPLYIETSILSLFSCLSDCIVIGEKRKYLSILLCLKLKMNKDGTVSNQLDSDSLIQSEKLNSTSLTIEEVQQDIQWIQYIDSIIHKYNTEYNVYSSKR